MRKKRLFKAFLMILLSFLFVSNAFAVGWSNREAVTNIYTYLYLCREDGSFEAISEVNIGEIESFEPITANNGNYIFFTLYATGELINLDYMGIETAGIESFLVEIQRVDVDGASVIEDVLMKEIIDSPTFVFRVNDLEEGFYRIRVKATSKANAVRSTTLENKDEHSESYFFFKVGDFSQEFISFSE